MSQMDPRDALCQLLLDVSSQDQQVVMKLLLFAQVLHCPQIKVKVKKVKSHSPKN